MKYLLFFSLLFALFSCTNSNPTTENNDPNLDSLSTMQGLLKQNDWDKKNLKGKIKERKVLVYNNASKTKEVSKDKLIGGLLVRYDKQGNELENSSYNEKKEVASTWKHNYNKQGNRTESIFTNAKLKRKFTYTYDNNGNCLEWKEFTNDTLVKTTQYTYNAKGQEMEALEKLVAGVEVKSIHEYDKQNKRRETSIYDETGALNIKYLYSYNELGQEIQQSTIGGDNSPVYKRLLEYDTYNNKLRELSYTGDGLVNRADSFKYSYLYDEQKNWTQRITENEEGLIIEIAEQTFVYF